MTTFNRELSEYEVFSYLLICHNTKFAAIRIIKTTGKCPNIAFAFGILNYINQVLNKPKGGDLREQEVYLSDILAPQPVIKFYFFFFIHVDLEKLPSVQLQNYVFTGGQNLRKNVPKRKPAEASHVQKKEQKRKAGLVLCSSRKEATTGTYQVKLRLFMY